MQGRIKLLPSRSSTLGGPVMFLAGLCFLSIGLFYQYTGSKTLSASLLISLGFLATGLGSTILIYMRRVSVRTILEKLDTHGQNRFRIVLSDPGGQILLTGDFTQNKELRISPRSGAVLFLRLPGNIYLEVHKFSSRREAARKFARIEKLQEDCILPAQSEPPVPYLHRGSFNRLRIVFSERTVIWSDPIALETALPLAVFFSGVVFLVLHGLEMDIHVLLRGIIVGALGLATFTGGLVSSSIRYIRMSPGELEHGRFLFRFRLKGKQSLQDFASVLHQKQRITDRGAWQLWREEVLPTCELRLYHESGNIKKPLKRIRLHSSLATSVAIFQNLQSLYGPQPPRLIKNKE
ncbi:MAG: hypothetical protein RH862_01460 [Leptospiraceae bacterium]